MKDFDYYRVPNGHYWDYESKTAFRKAFIDEINSTPLTAAEREKKLKEVPSLVREKDAEMNKPARDRQVILDAEFWADAREDCGYYSDAVWKIICSEAYDQGHAYGYSEIYSKLVDITEFVDKILAVK